MKLDEAKQRFIQYWGTLGTNWGINRTMAQVHALLLATSQKLSADEIMEALQISRGNANMNVRALIDWGLVYRELVPGDRKEYFRAEKDIHKVARQIIKMRKQREIDPILAAIKDIKQIDIKDEKEKEEAKHFTQMMEQIEDFTRNADNVASKMLAADESWMGKVILKLLS